ncbi:MAG TPA: hypothetical protein VGG03_10345 [Thermoanaerobaculia bacterium]|jgi:hypothetical protein
MSTRRDFLRSLLGAGALAGLGRGAVLAANPARRLVPLGLLLAPGSATERGASLGFEEAQRAGDLLQVEFRLAPTSGYALIGSTPPKGSIRALFLVAGAPGGSDVPVRLRVYSVASSPRFRREVLARHPGKGLRAVDWHPSLERFGADSLNLRFQRRFGRSMDEDAWRGWMAVKIAAELALRSPGADPAAKVGTASFDGHKGIPLRFDPQDHHLIQPVYVVDARGKLVDEVAPE